MVVHIGSYSTEIAVVVESTVRTDVGGCVEVGREDCIRHLAALLSKEAALQEPIKAKMEGGKSAHAIDLVMRELAEAILDDEDHSKVAIPLASGSKAADIGESGQQEEEEGVLNVAKMWVSLSASKPSQLIIASAAFLRHKVFRAGTRRQYSSSKKAKTRRALPQTPPPRLRLRKRRLREQRKPRQKRPLMSRRIASHP